jgi:hypothetical protein
MGVLCDIGSTSAWQSPSKLQDMQEEYSYVFLLQSRYCISHTFLPQQMVLIFCFNIGSIVTYITLSTE